jgi:hypothetical protein
MRSKGGKPTSSNAPLRQAAQIRHPLEQSEEAGARPHGAAAGQRRAPRRNPPHGCDGFVRRSHQAGPAGQASSAGVCADLIKTLAPADYVPFTNVQ